MQTGYVASPDCFKTFGLLGAESSATTAHLAAPFPVLVAVHPGGGAPVFKSSKFTLSESALLFVRLVISASVCKVLNVSIYEFLVWFPVGFCCGIYIISLRGHPRGCFLSWSLGWCGHGFGSLQGGFYRARQLLCSSTSPVVKENHARFLADHVVMDGDDIDAGFAE